MSIFRAIKPLIVFGGAIAAGVFASMDENVIFGLVVAMMALLCFDLLDFYHIFPSKKSRSFSLFIIFLIVFRTFFYDVMYVPSGSMTPTLLTGDYVLVKKYEYGFNKESLFPFGKLLPILPTYQRKEPKRGEVVVWTRATDPSFKYYVKRAVAIDGDVFQMKDGMLHINEQASTVNEKLNAPMLYDDGTVCEVKVFEETSPDGNTIRNTVRDRAFGDARSDSTHPITVPKKHFAIVGDNRTNGGSWDSRDTSEFPPMPYSQIIGKPKVVLFSTTSWTKFPRDVAWGTWLVQLPLRFIYTFLYVRLDRFFMPVN